MEKPQNTDLMIGSSTLSEGTKDEKGVLGVMVSMNGSNPFGQDSSSWGRAKFNFGN